MENKKYIKKMQKQIINHKKYIVFLETRCAEYKKEIEKLNNINNINETIIKLLSYVVFRSKNDKKTRI